MKVRLVYGLALILPAALVPMVCSRPRDSGQPPAVVSSTAGVPPPARVSVATPPPSPALADDPAFEDAARSAWRFIDKHYQPATGLVSALAEYQYATIWDIGSGLAALYCARELGLLDPGDYDKRLARALKTLSSLPLFGGIAFNRSYSTRTGTMADRDAHTATRGNGWSPTDLGRLLIWLKVIATKQPEHAAAVLGIVRRMDASRLVKDGYLWGLSLDASGRAREYQEGRIGYEQYAAAGFAAWGLRAEKAERLRENGLPLSVMGLPLLADLRGADRLTSEPLVLLGLEVGWEPDVRALAQSLLAAQEERYRRTGHVTIVSEDAIDQPPHYFYYYCVYAGAREFAVDVQDPRASVSGPRWVSAKAAYAWHALLPTEYTRLALDTVAPARTARGWDSGVFESSGRSTSSANINTQAVILEAALYRKRGRPLLEKPGD